MKKLNKILAIIILVLSIIGIMVTIGVAYSYATISNTAQDTKTEVFTVKSHEEENKSNISNEKIESKKTNNTTYANKITFTEKREVVYASTDVNVRTEPNVNSEKMGVLVKGNSIVRTAIGSNGWDKVEYNNKEAYISHNYLSTTKIVVEQPKPIAQNNNQNNNSNNNPNNTPNNNPNNYLIKNVPFIAQNPKYPNGCEAASTTMLLNYYGMNITLTDFINNYLDMDKVYRKDGVLYGPNPEISYAGDPASARGGWGCFPTAIENAVNKLINKKYNNKHTVKKNTLNTSLQELTKSKKPIAIWTTITYDVVKGNYTWKSYDGKVTYTYPKDLHVIVVIGQDDNYYFVNDPLKKSGNTKIEKSKLEKSFDSMGRRAIMID